MKYYMLHITLWNDETRISISKDGNTKRDDSFAFSIPTWSEETDWQKVFSIVKFFDAEWVIICPRFDNADDFTSPIVEAFNAN